ncbi:uncharacterized protein EAF01_001091 [Botrytis porri]|uniref:Transmembrane protein n=1 Tax=Botrytis porri TaxID=87229 RepID=A0A4Z1KMP8_9HELO|nr:uncharacterized protein EAF01_001091 [Botrytis porri]KAF7914685.1 hypothetical protein EAF01_001091 [Botrytis porri]TGO84874.1 hypothetical protein BPOR_0456g00090 [Botrytis porri]
MYIPKEPERSGVVTIQEVAQSAFRMMTTILEQTPHRYQYTNIHTRSEKITSDRKSQDSARTWILAIPAGVMIVLFLSFICGIVIEKKAEQKKCRYTQRPLSRTKTTPSRQSRNDSRTLCPVYSHRPKPTGEMGAARAALGATISPAPTNSSIEEDHTASSLRNQGYYRPTGQIGAARAALGARVEPEARQARTNNDRSIRFQQSYVPTDIGSRIVSRPVEQPDSIYTLRPRESVADMMQRVDREVHRAVARYPIFATNLPSPPPAHLRRPSRPTGPTTIDEEVSRQVASFPIFQQNTVTQHAMATGSNEEQYREFTTITTASANTEIDNEELRREVATLPVFQNTAGYRPMPTRRPDPVTPPPAYSHAPSYRGYDSHEEAPENEADDSVDEENCVTTPSTLPPAYIRGD